MNLLEIQLFAPARVVWSRIDAGRLLYPALRAVPPVTGVDGRPVIKENVSYLVTGGFGALGLQTADWLVQQGARHVVLMGRGGRKDGSAASIERWQRQGAQCLELACDVANAGQLEAAFRRIRDTMPDLRGIVHCAGVLDDATVSNLQWPQVRKTLAPKADGSWNLHRESLGLKLDFFVMFSSLASLFGNPGQANYAAANAFLDGLAHYRRSLGLPAVSVCWGAWAASGMGGENRMLNRLLERFGARRFASGAAFEALGQILNSGKAQYAVTSFDRDRLNPDALTALLRGSSPGAAGKPTAASSAGRFWKRRRTRAGTSWPSFSSVSRELF
jgi:NAD(P)-dependent dehydrogenase (short-subunit alcohol dehydrogenase family)